MKGHATEGGTRVPAIITSPDKHNDARIAASFGSVLDIAPTIYDVAGVAYPQTYREHELDPLAGTSMLPYIKGSSERIHDADYSMGWELFGRAAFRRGRWKVTWIEKPFGTSEFELFDIENDPGETHNLREAHPEIYRELVDGFRGVHTSEWSRYCSSRTLEVSDSRTRSFLHTPVRVQNQI